MRRLFALGIRQGGDDALDGDQVLSELFLAGRAEQVLDTKLIDPDAPQVEEAKAEHQDYDGSSGQRVRDQPFQHLFTTGRKM